MNGRNIHKTYLLFVSRQGFNGFIYNATGETITDIFFSCWENDIHIN